MHCGSGYGCEYVTLDGTHSVLPFSKLNKIFFGYFDAENVFIDNENKNVFIDNENK